MQGTIVMIVTSKSEKSKNRTGISTRLLQLRYPQKIRYVCFQLIKLLAEVTNTCSGAVYELLQLLQHVDPSGATLRQALAKINLVIGSALFR